MTVYVAQQPRPFRDRHSNSVRLPDLSPATQYGAVRFVFGDQDQPGLMPGQSVLQARKALATFCDDDYILWAGGDPVALMIAGFVAAQINKGRVKFLRWEKNSNRVAPGQGAAGFYMPVDLRMDER
jgi:hypothetical protein